MCRTKYGDDWDTFKKHEAPSLEKNLFGSGAQGAGDQFSFQIADNIEDADLHDEDIGQ
ncbi:hypothetical protein T492DRAFT_885786 [Pavlovales sp. CCMP2436]|nr:hypothetical protein T492DRAFT_885786 [Pavlovales sp. CCMP2436]